jgi:hypothetical protein
VAEKPGCENGALRQGDARTQAHDSAQRRDSTQREGDSAQQQDSTQARGSEFERVYVWDPNTLCANITPALRTSFKDLYPLSSWDTGFYSERGPSRCVQICVAVRLLWPSLVSLLLTAAVSMALLPGFYTYAASHHSPSTDLELALVFAVYALCDLLSRVLPVPRACHGRDFLVATATVRCLLMPCAFVGHASAGRGGVVQMWYAALFGASNGYLTSCGVLTGVDRLSPELASVGTALLTLAMVAGAAIGLCVGAVLLPA